MYVCIVITTNKGYTTMKKKGDEKEKRKYTRREGSKPPGNPNIKPRQSTLKTHQEVQERIDKYFAECEKTKRPMTVMGLANALGLHSRKALLNYEKEGYNKDLPEKEKKLIISSIKKAKARIEQYLEENLIKGRQVVGTIFNLKNNYGWVDKQEIEIEEKKILVLDV